MMGCMSESCVRFITVLLAHVGLFLSLYALYVEKMKTMDPKYKAMCDISKDMSCSKVFTSSHGTGFGVVGQLLGKKHPLNVANGWYGVALYTLVSLLASGQSRCLRFIQLLLTTAAVAGSGYLGYVLFYVIKDLCVVCIATYVVNALLFLLTVCGLCCGGQAVAANSAAAKQAQAAGKRRKRD